MTQDSTHIDKESLYGKFQRTADWQDKLHKKLAHKSLDIGEQDEMQVDNSRTQLGITWKELAVLAATGLGGLYMFNQWNQPATPQQQQPTQSAPVDSEYQVRFYDAEGNPIDVKPLPRK